ncbi:hypothetical protein CAOG_08278 [Capsaspora owczarzaki ATCC 30864]|uniref:hypothetical protein n=1 Tax=Capsaspora owczarzaki (strain ATCC 30864) TaxID=595528 RepID=UPI0001FE6417|nr:hypothetical protein CAOG_08278 [Capsaspora owczarzaki ATCC 30864]|eukprot:XP_004342394.1 hypothetical protein CAOG_08278 [Capsaspora owczarzaki ATCC 30864]
MAMNEFQPEMDEINFKSPKAPQTAADRVEELKALRFSLRANIHRANMSAAKFYDRHHKAAPPITVGSLVTVLRRSQTAEQPYAKLAYVRDGPFKVVKQINERAFELDLGEASSKSRTFHVSVLELFIADAVEGRIRRVLPPVKDWDGTVRHRVEAVIDSTRHSEIMYYRIRRVGTTAREDTWEPAKDVWARFPRAVRLFHLAEPSLPQPTREEFDIRFTNGSPSVQANHVQPTASRTPAAPAGHAPPQASASPVATRSVATPSAVAARSVATPPTAAASPAASPLVKSASALPTSRPGSTPPRYDVWGANNILVVAEDEDHLLESRVGLDCECVAPELMEAWACLEFFVFAAREGVLPRAIENKASEVRNSVGRVDGCEVEASSAPQRPECPSGQVEQDGETRARVVVLLVHNE